MWYARSAQSKENFNGSKKASSLCNTCNCSDIHSQRTSIDAVCEPALYFAVWIVAANVDGL